MWFSRYKNSFISILFPALLSVLVQSIARIYLTINQSPAGLIRDNSADVIKVFITGIRFDIRVVSIVFSIIVVLALFFSINNKLFNIWKKVFPVISAIFTILIFIITLGNVFYFKTYGNPIDAFAFSIFDDDTIAILRTIWSDYPVIILVIVSVLAFFGLKYIYRRWLNFLCKRLNRVYKLPIVIFLTLFSTFLIFAGARGSFSKFPLRQNNTNVSSIPLLNLFVPNGGISLDWAYQVYLKGKFETVADNQGEALVSSFIGKQVAINEMRDILTAQTPSSVVAENSHVVLAIMESMGQHLMQFDTPDRDLYGRLRKHWETDITMTRFLPEGNGTISSLIRLLMRSPMSFLSQTAESRTDFETNMLKPYINNGYKVVFITSGSGTWQSLGTFAQKIGVTEFVESNTLKAIYPEIKETPWGVPDEYLFKYAAERLKKGDEDGEKLLIILLSISFHPPYTVPDQSMFMDFAYTAEEKVRLSNLRSTGGVLNDVFSTFRYVNDQLGGFIDYIKSTELAERTVIAVTGDHNIRGIGYNDLSELALGYASAFYLYHPGDMSTFDSGRVGSHKDIWPTLYNLTLTDTLYFKSGCDLLNEQDPIWCFGMNERLVIDNTGAYYIDTFYPWADSVSLLLGERKTLDQEQDNIFKRYSNYDSMLKWLSNKQVQNWKENQKGH